MKDELLEVGEGEFKTIMEGFVRGEDILADCYRANNPQ